MRAVTYISDNGTTIRFSGTDPSNRLAPFYFRRLTDSVGANAEVVKSPRQDGLTTPYVSLSNRTIVIDGQLWALGDKDNPARQARDRHRALLHQAFIPKTWGTLIYHTEDGGRQIRARAVSTPTITETEGGILCDVSVDLITDAAYWESTDLHTEMAGGYVSLWRFAWSPVSAPMGTFRPWMYVGNPWVEPIYPTIEVYTTSKIVTITNQTSGKHITINHPIAEGQKLVVEMDEVLATLWERDETGVYREREDVSHWMTWDSDPWALEPGKNTVYVSNEDPNATPVSVLSFRLPYGGV